MFDDLPKDMQRFIFSFFKKRELIDFSLVSKSFKTVCEDDQLWKVHLKKDFDCQSPNNVKPKEYYKKIILEKKNIIDFATQYILCLSGYIPYDFKSLYKHRLQPQQFFAEPSIKSAGYLVERMNIGAFLHIYFQNMLIDNASTLTDESFSGAAIYIPSQYSRDINTIRYLFKDLFLESVFQTNSIAVLNTLLTKFPAIANDKLWQKISLLDEAIIVQSVEILERLMQTSVKALVNSSPNLDIASGLPLVRMLEKYVSQKSATLEEMIMLLLNNGADPNLSAGACPSAKAFCRSKYDELPDLQPFFDRVLDWNLNAEDILEDTIRMRF